MISDNSALLTPLSVDFLALAIYCPLLNLNSTAQVVPEWSADTKAFRLKPTWGSPLSVDFRTWLWRYTYLLLLISMLWHRQAIFKSKGDKLCSSAECRIWTRGPRHQIASRLNARWQTDWAIEDQAKNLNSTARPYDQRAFSPLDPTVSWLSHLALAIYIFVVVNFDALAQASDIQIERRQVVFLCWMQDLNPGPQTPNRQQTECSLTNPTELSRIKLKTWTRQPVPMIGEHSAHLAPLSVDFRTWLWRYTYLLLISEPGPRHQIASWLNALTKPNLTYDQHCQLTFAPGSGDIHICCC